MKSARREPGKTDQRLPAASLAKRVTDWYRQHRRDLPWRLSRDPYRIWISEIMLQQTTVAAVIPYYDRFLKAFPTVKALAESPLERVLEQWSGLGYYSRARNLHKAAIILAETGFPQKSQELIQLPGFGPYTSRAVAALAFSEKVGVLDGNVIRSLSRWSGQPIEHWRPSGRDLLQNWADELAQFEDPSDLNQGLMDLGATICTPQAPLCLLCPWQKDCQARLTKKIDSLPLKKPRKEFEVWSWTPEVQLFKKEVALVQNPEMPFLKGQWVFPGEIKKLRRKPEKFDLKHGITHHDIYIQVKTRPVKVKQKDLKWCSVDEISSVNPSILLQKVLQKVLP